MTFAVVDVVYSFATPGRNVPNEAGEPSDRLSVAATVPPGSGGLVDAVVRAAAVGVIEVAAAGQARAGDLRAVAVRRASPV